MAPRPRLLEEFQNGGFTLKMHQMFSVRTTLEEFKNATIIGHFEGLVEKKFVQGNQMIILVSPFQKAPFSKCFSATLKR